MDRVNGANWVDIGGGRRGFRSEDLVNGLIGTEVTSLWTNAVQEEFLAVIEAANLVPDDGDWTQLLQALKRMGLSGGSRARRWMALSSVTLSSAPGSPSEGDAYLIPVGATGIWAEQVGKIAEWTGTAWSYTTMPDGHGIGLPDGRVFVKIAGVYEELVAGNSFKGLVSLNQIKQTSGEVFKQASTRVDATHVPLLPLPVSNVVTIVSPVSFADDGQGDWALVGNRVVCQRAGRYLFTLSFGVNSTGAGYAFSGGLYLNGAEFLWGATRLATAIVHNVYAAGSTIRDMAVGDYLEFLVYQEGMSTSATINYRTRAAMLRLAI